MVCSVGRRIVRLAEEPTDAEERTHADHRGDAELRLDVEEKLLRLEPRVSLSGYIEAALRETMRVAKWWKVGAKPPSPRRD